MSGREPPAALLAAIESRLEGRPRAALQESARRLSEAYRARKSTEAAIRNETDALAYALTRMPATYAAVAAALARLDEHCPDFAPRHVLDIGCGLAAASYAACARWPSIGAVTLVDRNRPFLELARSLARDAGTAPLACATFLEADLTRLPDGAPRDLVVAAYTLTELAKDDLPAVTEALWARTAGTLVLVEPGTPRDHARLMEARRRLIEAGATVLAPCPHDAPCPLPAPDWCHFSVRLPRRRAHRQLKGGEAPFEDEKFAYLIAARVTNETGDGHHRQTAARILAPPRAGKAGVILKLCTQRGFFESYIPKRDKPRYEGIRRKDWGDATDAPVAATAPQTRE